MSHLMKRSLRRSGLYLIAFMFLAQSAISAGNGSPGVRRPIEVSEQGAIWQSANYVASAGSDITATPAISVKAVTVDSELYTGYENAIYAADDNTVFVAYKRFLSDPRNSGYISAELRVAKSIDGGRTWTISVVDPDAIEEGDLIDNSVSIDGDRGSNIYIAYHTRASGLFADMKLKVAKSTDAGATWTTQTVVSSNAGDQNSTRVLSANTVLVSAHANGTEEGIHTYITTNGGTTWTDTLVAGGLGNGLYTSVGGQGQGTIWVSYYNALYPDHTDMNAGHRARDGSWMTQVVDGTTGDSNLTGIGSSITVAPTRFVFAAYEADTTSGTFVRVARTTNGNGWNVVPVQQDITIGWNTAIHEANGEVYVSYWRVPSGSRGLAMFAMSKDNGVTWKPFTIPDPRYAEPYIDSTAPSTATQYESYQTVDPTSFDQPILRVARISQGGG